MDDNIINIMECEDGQDIDIPMNEDNEIFILVMMHCIIENNKVNMSEEEQI